MTVVLGVSWAVPSFPAAAAAAAGPAALLDPGFGVHGMVLRPSKYATTAYGEATPDGDLLVSGGSSIEVVGSGGDVGEAFGATGTLAIPVADGPEFRLADFTIDSHGRLLVLGTSVMSPEEDAGLVAEEGRYAFLPGELRIVRFLPDGALDPTFGQDGVLETGLGLSPPVDRDGQPLDTHPAITASGIAVDRQGRIVVTGDVVVGTEGSCSHDIYSSIGVAASLVVRFDEDGVLDESFGRGGIVGGSGGGDPLGAREIGEPVVGPAGQITYRSTNAFLCEYVHTKRGIAQLTPAGGPSLLGGDGAIPGAYRALLAESDGSVLAVFSIRRPYRDRDRPVRLGVLRIRPDGRIDRTFGTQGRATLTFPRGSQISFDALAVDPRGRILLGGRVETDDGEAMALLRLSPDGRWQKNFGPHGMVITHVRKGIRLGADDLFFDPEGRLVSVHDYSTRLHYGVVVARYLLRH